MLLVLLLLVILLGARKLFGSEFFAAEQLANQVVGASALQGVLYFFAAVAFTALGLPRQLIAFVAGFVFGAVVGTLISLVAASLGCAVAFFLARYVLRRVVENRYPKLVTGLHKLIADDAFLKIVVLRLQPLGTNLLTNLCAGVSDIRAVVFLAASALGYVPQMLVFALSGSGLRVGSVAQLSVSAALFVISLFLAAYLFRQHRIRLQG